MDVVELTGAIVKEAELSDELLWWGSCSGDVEWDKEEGKGKGKGGRP